MARSALFLVLLFSVGGALGASVLEEEGNSNVVGVSEGEWRDEGRGFLDEVVQVLVDSQVISKEDAQVYQKHGGNRQGRSNPLSELAFDVFKEVVAEFLSATVGSYLGLPTRRTSEDLNLISMILGAVRKSTIQKRMGCPT